MVVDGQKGTIVVRISSGRGLDLPVNRMLDMVDGVPEEGDSQCAAGKMTTYVKLDLTLVKTGARLKAARAVAPLYLREQRRSSCQIGEDYGSDETVADWTLTRYHPTTLLGSHPDPSPRHPNSSPSPPDPPPFRPGSHSQHTHPLAPSPSPSYPHV
jgi:hypothetical protein